MLESFSDLWSLALEKMAIRGNWVGESPHCSAQGRLQSLKAGACSVSVWRCHVQQRVHLVNSDEFSKWFTCSSRKIGLLCLDAKDWVVVYARELKSCHGKARHCVSLFCPCSRGPKRAPARDHMLHAFRVSLCFNYRMCYFGTVWERERGRGGDFQQLNIMFFVTWNGFVT